MILHTVWIYWADDDSIELHGAHDDHTVAENHDAYRELVDGAGKRVGALNVREIKVSVDWNAVCAAFEPPPEIAGEVG